MIDVAELEALERLVGEALRTHDTSGLRLLGHGEISIVLGWPVDAPRVACKRLPPVDHEQYRRYAALVERYLAGMRDGGVRVVPTEVHRIVRRDGRVVAFHVQPVLDGATLADNILRSSEPVVGHPIVEAIVDVVMRAGSDRLGIDAQLSNWAWIDGEPWQLDFTSPFLFDERGDPELDLEPFLDVLPAVMRPLVRREVTRLMQRFRSPRGSLRDLAANVLKAGLADWLDPVLTTVNRRVDPPVTREEAERNFREDARLWPVLLRAERANRFWQQRVRRRPYEFLLPERSTYET